MFDFQTVRILAHFKVEKYIWWSLLTIYEWLRWIAHLRVACIALTETPVFSYHTVTYGNTIVKNSNGDVIYRSYEKDAKSTGILCDGKYQWL